MSIRSFRTMVLLPAAVALSACSAAAQQGLERADSAQDRNECRRAAQIVRTGRPAPHETWALRRIVACADEGPEAVALGIAAAAGLADDDVLRPLSDAAVALPHPRVLEASLDVAGSDRATPRARAWALRNVLGTLQPEIAHPSLATLAPPETDGLRACGLATNVEHPVALAPVPADARPRALALAERLRDDAATPALVRSAAYCTARQLRTR